MASSVTSATSATPERQIAQQRSPTRRAPSESAATDRTSTSTGPPASSAAWSSGEPRRDSRDQSAAADRDQHGVERRRAEPRQILLPFPAHGSLAGDGRGGIVGVNGERTRLGDIGVAKRERLVIGGALDMYIGAVSFDLGDLHRRGDLRHEYARAYSEPSGGIGDRRAVIAARGCRATDRRCGAGQEIVERPAWLERTRMLQEFEFERNRRRSGDRGRSLEQRRAPDMPRYARVRRIDFVRSGFM